MWVWIQLGALGVKWFAKAVHVVELLCNFHPISVGVLLMHPVRIHSAEQAVFSLSAFRVWANIHVVRKCRLSRSILRYPPIPSPCKSHSRYCSNDFKKSLEISYKCMWTHTSGHLVFQKNLWKPEVPFKIMPHLKSFLPDHLSGPPLCWWSCGFSLLKGANLRCRKIWKLNSYFHHFVVVMTLWSVIVLPLEVLNLSWKRGIH